MGFVFLKLNWKIDLRETSGNIVWTHNDTSENFSALKKKRSFSIFQTHVFVSEWLMRTKFLKMIQYWGNWKQCVILPDILPWALLLYCTSTKRACFGRWLDPMVETFFYVETAVMAPLLKRTVIYCCCLKWLVCLRDFGDFNLRFKKQNNSQ